MPLHFSVPRKGYFGLSGPSYASGLLHGCAKRLGLIACVLCLCKMGILMWVP